MGKKGDMMPPVEHSQSFSLSHISLLSEIPLAIMYQMPLNDSWYKVKGIHFEVQKCSTLLRSGFREISLGLFDLMALTYL